MSDDSGIITYTWAGNADIAQVDMRKDGDRGITAYLYASENAAHLYQLREIFKGNGWTASSELRNGKPVLRLTGLTDENTLINLLQHGGYADGAVQITSSVQKNAGGLDALKQNSLKASGALYLVGDALMFWSGLKHGKSMNQMGTSMAFGAGDIAFLAFGGHNEQREFTQLLKDLKKYLHKKNVEIPDYSALNAETMVKPGGFLEHVHDYIYQYINPFKIAMEILGGWLYFKTGRQKPDAEHPDRVSNPQKTASGAIIMTGWAAALLIKEKKIDQEKYEKAGPLQKVWMKMQSNPLAFAGGAGLIHNALTMIGAVRERNAYNRGDRQTGSPYWKWDMAAILFGMIPANILFSISKKKGARNDTMDDNALTQDVYGIAVQVLSHQPESEREATLDAIADFLSERHEIKGTRSEIKDQLRQEMEQLKNNNPWFANPPEQQVQKSHANDYLKTIQMPENLATPTGNSR